MEPNVGKEIEEEKDEEKIKKEEITEFVRGKKIFASTGVSKVKVTIKGEVICRSIPIQSTGISELVDSLEEEAPVPPAKKYLADPEDPNDEIAADLKIGRKKWIKIPDLTDPEYMKAKEKHSQRVGIAVMFKGLAVEVKEANGAIVTDNEIKMEIFKEMGLSSEQFSQIINDIRNLTQWTEEERESFLRES